MIRLGAIAALLSVVLLVASRAGHAQDSIDPAAFHARVDQLYSFVPRTLESDEMQAKSNSLDEFWNEVKQSPETYIPLLRAELQDTLNSRFFSYDGSKLLLSLSSKKDDQALALESISRADLRDIQHTDYLRTVHWFATNDFDVTTAATRILEYPDFQAFIAEHSLTLGQDYALICMLAPMPESRYLKSLVERLGLEQEIPSQKSILLALWYSMSPEGKTALESFSANSAKPEEPREYARQLQERKVSPSGVAKSTSVEQLKEERRKVMHRLSDEALYEFDELSAEILRLL